jgi:mono/diheme cytochrome c family protein
MVKPFIALSLLGLIFSASAQEMSGKQIYQLYCMGCHDPGPVHPGTAQLSRKRGKDQAVIKGRQDLAPEYIRQVVRHGLIEMPPFRPSEINEEQLQALIAYLKGKKEE